MRGSHTGHTCGRCGLPFPTRYALAHHGCELPGCEGLTSAACGEVLRADHADWCDDPDHVERLIGTIGVRRKATILAYQRQRARALGPIAAMLHDLGARMARAFDSCRDNLPFGGIRAEDLAIAPVVSQQLTLDDFLAHKRTLPPPTPIRAWAPLTEEEITIRAQGSPLPFVEVARRFHEALADDRLRAEMAARLREDAAEIERAAITPRHRPAPSPVPPPPAPRRRCSTRRAGNAGGTKRSRARRRGQ